MSTPKRRGNLVHVNGFSTRPDKAAPWLLEGDPAIRWQALRDLVGASSSEIERQRHRVAHEGWGARLLRRQGRAGGWASNQSSDGGLYLPKWTSTTYSMLLLRDLGLPPDNAKAQRACALLLERGARQDGGINYGRARRSETCITGMVLSILSYFHYQDQRLDSLARYLLREQMSDGGWNCRRWRGATHSSVHTTISALESLRYYRLHQSDQAPALENAQARGREFLLRHRLFRSDRTGEVIDPLFLRFSFPPRWHYDVLRALDYFQAVNAPRDPRLAEGIALVAKSRCSDGRWPLQSSYPGKTYFRLERVGAPSRWNTLRALRVLRWWEGGMAGR